MLLAGLLVLLLGFGLMIVGSADQAGTSTGAVVFIGPFPIAFGSGPNGSSLALVSVVIGAVMIVLVMLWGWRFLGISGREVG
ncbi:MAG TPA: DUF131 domain-containing protein [Nitrososphaerales archaeon]|nr:DUF131 domain-containing protein [Nitrososphaerales archaeon]